MNYVYIHLDIFWKHVIILPLVVVYTESIKIYQLKILNYYIDDYTHYLTLNKKRQSDVQNFRYMPFEEKNEERPGKIGSPINGKKKYAKG